MSAEIDNEIKKLALKSLRVLFWRDFSALVNNYLEAAEGLQKEHGGQDFETQLQTAANVKKRDEEATDVEPMNIYVEYQNSSMSYGYDNLQEAILDDDAESVYCHGVCLFVRDENWQWKLGNKESAEVDHE